MRFYLFFLLALIGPLQAAPIRIVGSDLLSPSLDAGLKAYADREDRELAVNLQGSDVGLTKLRQQDADLALLVFPPDTELPSKEFVLLPVAYYTAVLAVRNAIPINQLTYAQIGGIYGDSEKESYRRWGDVGATGLWAGRAILATAISRKQSLSFDLLRTEVLKMNRVRPTVLQFDTPEQVIARISGEEGGLAVLPSPPPESSGLKALSISRTAEAVAYPPTSDNVHSGDYPLRLPLYLAFRKADAKRLNPVLRFLLGEDALPLWPRAGLIAAPVQVRNQAIFDLEVM